jgi:hypothetical protein
VGRMGIDLGSEGEAKMVEGFRWAPGDGVERLEMGEFVEGERV